MTLRRFSLGETSLTQYSELTAEELEAWNHPTQDSYHSYHIERMGHNTFRFRDSASTSYYIGTWQEVAEALLQLRCRAPDLDRLTRITPLTLLSQSEVDDLLGDL